MLNRLSRWRTFVITWGARESIIMMMLSRGASSRRNIEATHTLILPYDDAHTPRRGDKQGASAAGPSRMSSDSEGQVSSSDEDNSNDSDFVPERKPAAKPPTKEKGAKAPRPAARSSKAPAVKKEKKTGTTAPRKRQPAVKKTPAAPKPKKKADDDGKASDVPKTRKARAPRRKRAAEDDSDEGREAFEDDDEEAEEDEHTDDEERGSGRKKKRGRKRKATAAVKADETLLKIKELAVELARKKEAGEELPTLKALGFDNVREVAHMAPEKVIFEVEKLFVECARSILQGQGFGFTVPTRVAGNQMYIPELDRIVLKDKAARRTFLNHREVRKTAITTRILQLVHEVLSKGIHITKRDMFYTDVKLFKDQRDSDVVLEDVSCAIGCTRSSLHVVASEKGLVVGRISFMEDGDPIDCSRMGVGGKAIPPFIDRITNIQSDAEFILVVEKEAAYLRIAEDRFYNKFKCIVITAKGQPDVATRLFLRKIKTALNIPVLGLMDADPYGLKILSVYMTGSKNMSYDSASLTTSDIKWLGVRPSDLDKYNIPEQCRLDMTAEDIKQGQRLLEEEFIQKNPAWVKELEMMLQTKKKAEIQALSAFGFQYITESYLPRKLKKGDWI